MGVDHSKALLRIIFHGLFIICRNNSFQWEVGVPKLDDHDLGMKLVTITGGIDPKTEVLNINPKQDISISAPALSASLFNPTGFNRFSDTGDPEDYRWILDMEGREMHEGQTMKLRPGGGGYKAKILIDGGQLYSAVKTVERYRRENIADPTGDRVEIGKLAIIAGINIERLDPGSRTILLQNSGGATPPRPLKQERGVRYELNITHGPQATAVSTANATHFHHYYTVLKADAADTQ